MGRYRAPLPKASPYITAEGYNRLQGELDGLWKRRADVTKALAAAAAEGDRSENAEYIYRKKELREIDRRIRYLQIRLPQLNIVREVPSDRRRIFFGAWVRLEDTLGNIAVYRIVGPDEFDLKKGFISIESPLARALMKRTIDDEISVETPEDRKVYYVMDVSYDGIDASGT